MSLNDKNGVCERWINILTSTPWRTVPTTFAVVLKTQKSAQQLQKTEEHHKTTPHGAMAVGSHTTMQDIVPVRPNLEGHDMSSVCRRQSEV